MDVNNFLAGRSQLVISSLVAAGVILGVLWMARRKKKTPNLMVGRVSGIYLYPVKSAAGMPVEEALCTPMGLNLPGTDVFDRAILVTTKDYNFITLRQMPTLALIKPTIHGNSIHLDAPNMETLVVKHNVSEPNCTVNLWGQLKSARDCGEGASVWLSTFLKRDGVRLCESVPGPKKRILRNIDWKFYSQFYRQPQVKKDDQVAFADMSPYMMTSESSLDDLNSKVDKPVSMCNFRPSIVIGGSPAFDEDSWRYMKIGEAKFSFFMLCNRCILTQVDQENGTRRQDQEPLKTLKTYRLVDPPFGKSPIFGTHWVLDNPGTIRVGDPVYVAKA